MKKTTLLISILFISTFIFGQKVCNKKRKDLIKSERISFITNKLNLTPAEAEKFWPVYNEYINKQDIILSDKRKNMHEFIKNQETLTDDQTLKLVNKYASLIQSESNLFIEYNKKFKKILPIKKVALLYKSENQFKRYLMNKLRKQKKHVSK